MKLFLRSSKRKLGIKLSSADESARVAGGRIRGNGKDGNTSDPQPHTLSSVRFPLSEQRLRRTLLMAPFFFKFRRKTALHCLLNVNDDVCEGPLGFLYSFYIYHKLFFISADRKLLYIVKLSGMMFGDDTATELHWVYDHCER